MRRFSLGAPIRSLLVALALAPTAAWAGPPLVLDDLEQPARLDRDVVGIPHIEAETEADLALVQGFAHARDRLFQMDVSRRTADGTLAELVGAPALSSDVLFRTLGVARAAERSLNALSSRTRAALEAYASGVNQYVALHGLPPEYSVLEITELRPWTAADSVGVLKMITLQLALDLEDVDRTLTLLAYQQAGAQQGFDGAALFFEDTNRVAPFTPFATVPEASRRPMSGRDDDDDEPKRRVDASAVRDSLAMIGRRLLDRIDSSRELRRMLRHTEGKGSNQIAVAGSRSATGRPLIANDPHLPAVAPAFFIQNGLHAPKAGFEVVGASFPGVPYVILGQNETIAWGATTNVVDQGDFFQEQVVPDPSSPSGLSTVFAGQLEPVIPLPQAFRANLIGDGVPNNLATVPPGAGIPPAVLIVPRRNQGPLIDLDPATGVGLSLQFTGFSPTRELDAFRGFNLASSVSDFRNALQSFDYGAQNWIYVDVRGNVAYFTSGEIPLREDLQAGTVLGLSPSFIRNGTGGNEWIPAQSSDPNRAIPYEFLPFEELPQIVDPPNGVVINSNNDPSGTTFDNDPLNELRSGGGILYFGQTFAPGLRARRIADLIDAESRAGRRISADTLQRIQADAQLMDAAVFVPAITGALTRADTPSAHPALQQLAASARLREAVGRLATWDFSAPTGILEGYDASDVDGVRRAPSSAEVDKSVAATIYSVWRNQIIENVIVDTLSARGLPVLANRGEPVVALRNLFDRFAARQGVGASGLDFFARPGIADAATRRDLVVLESLAETLDLLAGDAFAAAFDRSTDLSTYRWGRLHRLVLSHPLGPPFSLPPAGGALPDPLAGLPGFPVDGGFVTVDVGTHVLRQSDSNGFLSQLTPAFRYVGAVETKGGGYGKGGTSIESRTSLAGGQSGVLGAPFSTDFVESYLTNETFELRTDPRGSEIVDSLDLRPPSQGGAKKPSRSPQFGRR